MSIDDLWYKNAVIYCLDVEKYQDANGDGIGDFEGLTRRLDYLPGLGVTCVWLQPFYPSPNRDNGYDVADYYSVHPKHGIARRLRRVHEPRRGARHPRDRRSRRQPHVRSTIRGSSRRASDPQSLLSRLVRLGRRAAEGPQRGHRLSRRADDDVDAATARRASTTSTASTTTSPT